MSWWATAYVGAQTHAPNGEPLTRDEKLMGMIVADHHDPSRNCAYPSVPRLAELALMSKRHAIDVLHELRRKEFLSIEPGGGRARTARYRILGLPKMAAMNSRNGAHDAPFFSGEGVQKECTAAGERVQKGCTAEQRYKEGTNLSDEPTKLSTAGAALKPALKAWAGIKKELGTLISESEWKLWVRPAYLLTVMSGNTLLVAMPPSGRIIDAAQIRLPTLLTRLVRERGYSAIRLTRYPDDHDRERLRREYPLFYRQMFGSRKGE
jgi:hypothetical protein